MPIRYQITRRRNSRIRRNIQTIDRQNIENLLRLIQENRNIELSFMIQ